MSTRARPSGAGWCGLVAGALMLGVAEMLDGLFDSVASPVAAVGEAVIDLAPEWFVRFGIDVFGQNDKAALAAGIIVLCGLAAVALGRLAAHRFGIAAAGFAAFGVVGLAAAARDPGASEALTAVALAVALAAGLAVLRLLLRLDAGSGAAPPAASHPAADRRVFLGVAGSSAVFAFAGALTGRRLKQSALASQREGITLPAPRRPAEAVPASAQARGADPVVTPNADFYRIDTRFFGPPLVDVDSWRLGVTGMVDEPFDLTFAELLDLPMVEDHVTLSCVSNEVGGSLVGNAVWLGVPLRALLDRAGVHSGADQIVGRAVDGFTAGFPTAAALDGRHALVAVGMNGEPLPNEHGFPARLVVAGLYGYVSATKWLSEIELTTFDAFDAYWVPRGWSRRAPVKTQSRIDTPRNRRRVRPGRVAVAGVAWAPTRGIDRVGVQVDDDPWERARLAAAISDSTWRQWSYAWDATPGEHVLRVRATDGDGERQTSELAPPAPDGATGWHTIRVRVEG